MDGVNTKNLKLEWLRQQIGLVTQEPALACVSISDNIAYGRPNITLDQIQEAASIANVHAFISSLEKGYDTKVCIHSLLVLVCSETIIFLHFFFNRWIKLV